MPPVLSPLPEAGSPRAPTCLPPVQRALVLERAGSLDGAATAAGEAIRSSPQDWRLWLVRSRVQAKRGNAAASVADYRRARTLNPRSSIFAR